jgi:two-component system sensor histidine kinase BaeS
VLSLRTRLSISYIVVALICILLVSLLANIFLENQFRTYIKQNLDRQNREIVAQLIREYDGDNGWNQLNVTNIGMNALEQGLIVKLKSIDGSVIWDATLHNNGLCRQMITHMAQNMASRYPNWRGNYIEHEYPVIKNFKTVGIAEIGFYGPFFFKDTDLAFINTLNRILVGVAILALFLALLIGSWMSRRLSAPIARVINTAGQIAGGNLAARSHQPSNIREIKQLITAINDLGQTLQQQELLRKRLTADMAHELRTPLTTLQSHIEAILDGIWQADPERLKVCHQEIMRVTRLVKDLEQLAKYENESLILNKNLSDIGELVKQIIINFEPEFSKKGVDLQLHLAETDGLISMDRDKISQVIMNLLSNALKFTPAGGAVHIITESHPEMAIIKIRDNGPGIAPRDLPYIFERFYRADQSRTRFTGGSGIGLTIAKAIVEAHKGSITVQSEMGKGSEFIISLPKEQLL